MRRVAAVCHDKKQIPISIQPTSCGALDGAAIARCQGLAGLKLSSSGPRPDSGHQHSDAN